MTKLGTKLLFAFSIGAAALSGLLFGFDTAVIAGVTGDLRTVFGLSDAWLGITVSIALWGTLAGAFGIGAPGDRWGGRAGLRVMALFYLVSALGCALAWDWTSFALARLVGGIAIGGTSVLAPVYIAEISPAARRGRLVGLFQLSVVSGILLAYLSNALIGEWVTEATWRWKLGVAAVPALLLLLLFWLIPNSPRWLAAKGRHEEARAACEALGIASAAMDAAEAPGTRLSFARHRRPILLATGLAAFNQLSGINAILYYLNDIFAAAGYGALSAAWQAVAIGLVNLGFTVLGITGADWLGRRRLLAIGGMGLTVSLLLTATVMFGLAPRPLLLPALIGFIGFFAMSQGAVIWTYISEIFPQEVRARGAALGSGTHWLLNALISAVFPMVAAVSAGAPFLFFAAMMAAMTVCVLRFYPETRGVRLEAMPSVH
ncbi:sugar porter family MFS transporter [Sphingomonas sp.]|uniref:sugar porter family MFS transporter n=1 Tax=Sphingomonas sp. TaxID=28214 RepID=UPI001B0833E7|nr:sugar porter family MFS transporter [Sphingomonas sp.]MBO9712016.1 sugar porter family MFS transporter [Sphingomonas sp.]